MSDIKYNLIESNELSPRVAIYFSQMEELRRNLIKKVENIPNEVLDFTPNGKLFETIGTLLLHIAAVEWSWIFEDIGGKEMDYEEWKYAFALRPSVNLPQLLGQGIDFYLNRLKKVHDEVFQYLINFTDQDLDRIIISSNNNKYSIEWILFHIIEHEAMHLGQISLLLRLYEVTRDNQHEKT